MPGPVAVTGATGFIGSALVEALTARGWSVRALTRRPRINTERLQWVGGDLADLRALTELVRGADSVVHCAGSVRGRSEAEFVRTNVQGTANLVAASGARKPAPRFLLISSLAAREPHLSWYAASKLGSEQILAQQAGAMPWGVFRPTSVYGPGDREIRPLLTAMQRGFLPRIGSKAQRFSLLHVHDLVEAIIRWLSAATPAPGVFELDDGTPGGYDWPLLRATAESVWQRRVRILTLPVTLMYAIAGLNLWLSRSSGYAPMLTPGKIRELTHRDWVCDNSALIRALNWRPRITLAEALSKDALLSG